MTLNYLLGQQADQKEQLRQLFSLVSTLGDEIRTVVKTAGQNPCINSTEELSDEDPKKVKRLRSVAYHSNRKKIRKTTTTTTSTTTKSGH